MYVNTYTYIQNVNISLPQHHQTFVSLWLAQEKKKTKFGCSCHWEQKWGKEHYSQPQPLLDISKAIVC